MLEIKKIIHSLMIIPIFLLTGCAGPAAVNIEQKDGYLSSIRAGLNFQQIPSESQQAQKEDKNQTTSSNNQSNNQTNQQINTKKI